MIMDNPEIKVKGVQLSNFLVENGCTLLRTEYKNKKKSGQMLYFFEHNDVFDSVLDLWEHEKKKYLFN